MIIMNVKNNSPSYSRKNLINNKNNQISNISGFIVNNVLSINNLSYSEVSQ